MVTDFSSYTGMDFLTFYGALLLAAAWAALLIPRFLRAEGRDHSVSDPGQLAVLAGKSGRFAEAVLASLYGAGALEEGEKNKLSVLHGATGHTPAERAITAKSGQFGITDAFKTLKPYAADIEERLVERGLLIDKGSRRRLGLVASTPFLALIGLGLYRRQAGEELGEPTGFLTILLVVTALLALWRCFKVDARTRAGLRTLDAAQERASRLKSAPTQAELGLGVALFGTAILAGTPFEQLHAMRQSATGDGGGGYSSDGGSDGDGGGDGGGCGGCGG